MLDATSFGLVAASDGIPAGEGETWRQLGRVLGAVAFGWALVFIYDTKSELLTSNMMIVSIGLINLGMLLVYNGMIKEDLTRALAMIVPVFIYAFLGLEHSVANSVLFLTVGFRTAIDVLGAVANVAVVVVGNVVGGGLLIGLYYAYANDDRPFLRRRSGTAPVE